MGPKNAKVKKWMQKNAGPHDVRLSRGMRDCRNVKPKYLNNADHS